MKKRVWPKIIGVLFLLLPCAAFEYFLAIPDDYRRFGTLRETLASAVPALFIVSSVYLLPIIQMTRACHVSNIGRPRSDWTGYGQGRTGYGRVQHMSLRAFLRVLSAMWLSAAVTCLGLAGTTAISLSADNAIVSTQLAVDVDGVRTAIKDAQDTLARRKWPERSKGQIEADIKRLEAGPLYTKSVAKQQQKDLSDATEKENQIKALIQLEHDLVTKCDAVARALGGFGGELYKILPGIEVQYAAAALPFLTRAWVLLLEMILTSFLVHVLFVMGESKAIEVGGAAPRHVSAGIEPPRTQRGCRTFEEWIEAHIQLDPTCAVSSREIFASYRAQCSEGRGSAPFHSAWGRWAIATGVSSEKSQGKRGWHGVRLK